ncbi:hypothetical protein ACFFWD_15095 [Bradyrhizobium erythrophlei]|uniref:hypothetical protein n=1 Tax=Bradyrhizobium erythrophlei TaxID=1437360 RepID=UPI0035E4B371
MPTFVVAFQHKADQSIFQMRVTADSAAEAVRVAREQYPAPAYAFVFITPSRDAEARRL